MSLIKYLSSRAAPCDYGVIDAAVKRLSCLLLECRFAGRRVCFFLMCATVNVVIVLGVFERLHSVYEVS